jgi:acetyl esterase/lipase
MPELDLARRIVYSVDGMSSVRSRHHVYRKDGDSELRLDIYTPPNTVRTLMPAVFFVHGGPIPPTMLPPREWGFFQSYGQLAAASGLVGVVLNHRLFAPTAYTTAEDDVRAAVDFVRANGEECGVDAGRIAVWAFSGGGPLLSWCLREHLPFVRCLLAFYAFLDLRHLVPPTAGAEQIERMHRLSPAVHLTGSSPPMFIARAGFDTAVLNASIDVFVRDALASNLLMDVHNHNQGHHGFDVLDDDPRSRDLVAKAIAFARAHLE